MKIGTLVRIKSKNLFGIVEYAKDDIYLVFCVTTPSYLHECGIDDLEEVII